jgi:extracellular factor (EF) 3-hydroxypalmitic acid methyl ester biosynthesis protein
MVVETTPPGALRYLEGEDLERLLSLGLLRSYAAGDTLYAPGERIAELVLVEEGELDVAGAGGSQRLGPGHWFGGRALAGAPAAEETVRAASDLTAIVLSLAAMEHLAQQQPEVAARLYLGLLVQDADRGDALSSLAVGQGPATEDRGGREARREARPLAEGTQLAEVRAAVREAQRSLSSIRPPEGEETAWVEAHRLRAAAVLDGLIVRVRQLAEAHGGSPQPVLDAARVELRPWLNRSRLAERMAERRPGEPARYRSLAHIYRNVPEGEDAAGLLLDAYLLGRPFADALRERRAEISDALQEEVRQRARPERIVRILSLGCGPARTLADLLDQPGIASLISLTAVDDDQEAIVYANNLLKGHAPLADITFHQTSPRDLSLTALDHRGYDVVASLYVADNLETADLAETIRRAAGWLNPGGTVLMAAFSDRDPDRWVTDLLLDWRPVYHHPEALREALLAGGAGSAVDVTPSRSGLNLIVRAARGD